MCPSADLNGAVPRLPIVELPLGCKTPDRDHHGGKRPGTRPGQVFPERGHECPQGLDCPVESASATNWPLVDEGRDTRVRRERATVAERQRIRNAEPE